MNMVEGGVILIIGVVDLEDFGFLVVIFLGGIVCVLVCVVNYYYVSFKVVGFNCLFVDWMLDFDGLNVEFNIDVMFVLGKCYEDWNG